MLESSVALKTEKNQKGPKRTKRTKKTTENDERDRQKKRNGRKGPQKLTKSAAEKNKDLINKDENLAKFLLEQFIKTTLAYSL